MKGLLGAARYEVDPNTHEAVVMDKYDFHELPGSSIPGLDEVTAIAGGKMGLARYLAAELLPPGKGRDVKINLGRLDKPIKKRKP